MPAAVAATIRPACSEGANSATGLEGSAASPRFVFLRSPDRFGSRSDISVERAKCQERIDRRPSFAYHSPMAVKTDERPRRLNFKSIADQKPQKLVSDKAFRIRQLGKQGMKLVSARKAF